MIILFCVIRKDVNNLYKWKTFQPKGLHLCEVLHADDLALMKAFGHTKENNHGNIRLDSIIKILKCIL